MKSVSILILIGVVFSGCAYFQGPHAQLIEAQPQLVEACKLLGVVSETADADRILSLPATYAMLSRVKKRALKLGATHIVWLHKTQDSAAAQAFKCPN